MANWSEVPEHIRDLFKFNRTIVQPAGNPNTYEDLPDGHPLLTAMQNVIAEIWSTDAGETLINHIRDLNVLTQDEPHRMIVSHYTPAYVTAVPSGQPSQHISIPALGKETCYVDVQGRMVVQPHAALVAHELAHAIFSTGANVADDEPWAAPTTLNYNWTALSNPEVNFKGSVGAGGSSLTPVDWENLVAQELDSSLPGRPSYASTGSRLDLDAGGSWTGDDEQVEHVLVDSSRDVASAIDLKVFSSSDLVIAFDGADKIIGGDGNDFLYGGKGNDEIAPGKGNDFVHGGDLTQGNVRNNDGNDTVRYSGTVNGVSIPLNGETSGGVRIDGSATITTGAPIFQNPALVGKNNDAINVINDGFGGQDTLYSIEHVYLPGATNDAGGTDPACLKQPSVPSESPFVTIANFRFSCVRSPKRAPISCWCRRALNASLASIASAPGRWRGRSKTPSPRCKAPPLVMRYGHLPSIGMKVRRAFTCRPSMVCLIPV
jgi:Ca2+-binding RTX toxin-like protein